MKYDHDRALQTYLLFHYGTREEILAGSPLQQAGATIDDAFFEFPTATVRWGQGLPAQQPGLGAGATPGRALDLGCAVGRSTFELSKFAGETIGLDFSRAFVDAAETLRLGEPIAYRRYTEAHLAETLTATLPAGTRPDRVRFETGDAQELRPDLGAFDLVHAANLLCRLASPRRLLDRLPALVRPGGRLILATPATWLEEYTPGANQPPGLTLEFLRSHLAGAFDLGQTAELPFLLREHARKFQISTAQTSLWTRRP